MVEVWPRACDLRQGNCSYVVTLCSQELYYTSSLCHLNTAVASLCRFVWNLFRFTCLVSCVRLIIIGMGWMYYVLFFSSSYSWQIYFILYYFFETWQLYFSRLKIKISKRSHTLLHWFRCNTNILSRPPKWVSCKYTTPYITTNIYIHAYAFEFLLKLHWICK